jgi:hypothetical protein
MLGTGSEPVKAGRSAAAPMQARSLTVGQRFRRRTRSVADRVAFMVTLRHGNPASHRSR